jgi:hypothetical protein
MTAKNYSKFLNGVFTPFRASTPTLAVGETGGSKGKKNHGRFARKKRKVQTSVAQNESRFFVVKTVIILVPRKGQSPLVLALRKGALPNG